MTNTKKCWKIENSRSRNYKEYFIVSIYNFCIQIKRNAKIYIPNNPINNLACSYCLNNLINFDSLNLQSDLFKRIF